MKFPFRTAVLAALFSLGALAQAQPGPDMAAPFALLAKSKAQLNLNTSQQLQWDNAVALSMSAHDALHASFGQLRSAMQSELGKDEPDLAAVASVADGVRQQNEAQRKVARDAWLALYATFTPEQKSVVRDTLKAGIARMEARHAMHGPHAED
jgi:hypothetical protein